MKIKKETWILLIILLAGLLFRLYHLGSESLWLDEGISIRWARMDLSQMINSASKDVHPPFYFVILHYWVALFGNSEIATRLLSSIFGVLSIAMIYQAGKLFFGRSVGLMAALILALSQFHIYFSQEARMYTLISLLSLCSMVCFLLLLRGKKYLRIAGYLLSNILLLYTHNFGFLIIAAQNIYMFVLFLRFKRVGEFTFSKWMILQIIPILFFLPWLMNPINQWLKIQKGYWMSPVSIRSIQQAFLDYSGAPVLCALFYALIMYAILFSFLRTKNKRIKVSNLFKRSTRAEHINVQPGVCLCMIWVLTPILIPFIISKLSQSIYIIRVTIATSPAFYLLAAKGIKSVRNKVLRIIIGIIIISNMLICLRSYYTEVKKERWSEVIEYIESQAQSGDLLIFNSGSYLANIYNYYSARSDIVKRGSPGGDLIDDNNIQAFAQVTRGYSRVWLILCQSGDRRGLMKKELSETFDLIYGNRFPSYSFQANEETAIEVCLFEKPG